MVYAFQAFMLFETVNARDTVFSDIQSRLQNRPIWGTMELSSFISSGGDPGLSVDVKYISKLDQEALVNRIENFLTGPRAPKTATNSGYSFHDCTHDPNQATVPCVAVWRIY